MDRPFERRLVDQRRAHALLAVARLMADDEGTLSDIESYIQRLHTIEQRLREIGS